MDAFGFNTTTTVRPRVKWDVKQGRFFRIDRTEDNGQWSTDEVELEGEAATFLLNIHSTVIGWAHLQQGQAPQEIMVPLTPGEPAPPKPAWPKATPSVEMQVKLCQAAGGEVRQMATTSMALRAAMSEMYSTVAQAPEHAAGKVPAVRITGKTSQKTKFGTNHTPVFEVISWHDRPEEFEDALAFARSTEGPIGETAQQQEDIDIPFDVAPAAAPAAAGDSTEELF